MRHARLTLTMASLTLLSPSVRALEFVVEAQASRSFSMPELSIAVGDEVRFQNAGGFHNVREVEGADSLIPVPDGFCAPLPGCVASASAWSTVVSFDAPGTYHYVCEVHGAAMRGRVTVLPRIFVNGFEGS